LKSQASRATEQTSDLQAALHKQQVIDAQVT